MGRWGLGSLPWALGGLQRTAETMLLWGRVLQPQVATIVSGCHSVRSPSQPAGGCPPNKQNPRGDEVAMAALGHKVKGSLGSTGCQERGPCWSLESPLSVLPRAELILFPLLKMPLLLPWAGPFSDSNISPERTLSPPRGAQPTAPGTASSSYFYIHFLTQLSSAPSKTGLHVPAPLPTEHPTQHGAWHVAQAQGLAAGWHPRGDAILDLPSPQAGSRAGNRPCT